MTNNAFIAFLVEIWQRLTSKSPKFFVIWQWILGALTAITGLPPIIDKFCAILGWVPPAVFINLENKTMALITAALWVFAKFPVNSADTPKLKYTAKQGPAGIVYSKPYQPPQPK